MTSFSISELLLETKHRPYEMPRRRQAMSQVWEHLLFAHWPVRLDDLRKLIPSELEIDSFDGYGWIGVVPFFMRDVRFTDIPLYRTDFCELNVRTYVQYKGRKGVYFFSLDASNPFAVEGARIMFALPYFHSDMQMSVSGDVVRYRSRRFDSRGGAANFDADYFPDGLIQHAENGSIEEFLTERYCFFTQSRQQSIAMCNIHHRRWPLQQAKAEIRTNTMLNSLGLQVKQNQPLLHYSRSLDTLEWFVEEPTSLQNRD